MEEKMDKLPKPPHEIGYTRHEVAEICQELEIDLSDFWEAFGINTCSMCDKCGRVLYYRCDVEAALYQLGHPLGEPHLWD
jgi:hypothetical protein